MKRWVWVIAAGSVVLALVASVVASRFGVGVTDGVVLVDNSYDVSVEVLFDGTSAFVLEPGQSSSFELGVGTHDIEVLGLDSQLLESSFEISASEETDGFRGIYVLGPGRGYALVGVTYRLNSPSTTVPPTIEPLNVTPGELYELPEEVAAAELDGTFPQLTVIPEGESAKTIVYLCHYSQADATSGCSYDDPFQTTISGVGPSPGPDADADE